jgi:16S rRNA (cytosine1402-N4)-methyltransferase
MSSGRGFSFEKDEPLLMTYDDSRRPVYALLREMSEPALANIIYELGGERYSRRIAKAIKERGRKEAITTSGELAAIVRQALPKGYERGRIDPATRTFQALRIYTNGELENLQAVLGNLSNIIKPGGRVAVISFHSLEDRIVKQTFQNLSKEGKVEILTKKPVGPTPTEEMHNPRSRSAKIRVAIMKAETNQ